MENQANSRVGRPAAFAPERAARAIEATRQGHTRRAAAQAAGVSESTLYAWLLAGEKPNASDEFLQFSESIRAADAQAEKELVDVILSDARNGNWRSSAWILERRFRENWASKRLVELQAAKAETQAAAIDAVISEANAAADAVMEIPKWIGKPLETWPPEVRRASGF